MSDENVVDAASALIVSTVEAFGAEQRAAALASVEKSRITVTKPIDARGGHITVETVVPQNAPRDEIDAILDGIFDAVERQAIINDLIKYHGDQINRRELLRGQMRDAADMEARFRMENETRSPGRRNAAATALSQKQHGDLAQMHNAIEQTKKEIDAGEDLIARSMMILGGASRLNVVLEAVEKQRRNAEMKAKTEAAA